MKRDMPETEMHIREERRSYRSEEEDRGEEEREGGVGALVEGVGGGCHGRWLSVVLQFFGGGEGAEVWLSPVDACEEISRLVLVSFTESSALSEHYVRYSGRSWEREGERKKVCVSVCVSQ